MKRLLTFGLLGLALALAGCTAPQPTATATATANGSRTPELALECDQLVPLERIAPVWGDSIVPVPYRQAGAAGSWEMQATALLQDGALACAWAETPGARPALVILALDDAKDGFLLSEPSFLSGEVFPYVAATVGDRSETVCRSDNPEAGTQCHWNVLTGSVWLSFFFQYLPESAAAAEGGAAPGGPIGELVEGAIAAIGSAEHTPIERPSSDLPRCDDVLTTSVVAETLGVAENTVQFASGRPVESSLGRSTPLFGQVMWAYSFGRLGYTECGFGTPDVSGSAMVAPGAAWILSEPGAQQPDLVAIEGIGEGIDACSGDSEFLLCTVAFAVGDDLVLAQVGPTTEEEGPKLALRLASLLAGR